MRRFQVSDQGGGVVHINAHSRLTKRQQKKFNSWRNEDCKPFVHGITTEEKNSYILGKWNCLCVLKESLFPKGFTVETAYEEAVKRNLSIPPLRVHSLLLQMRVDTFKKIGVSCLIVTGLIDHGGRNDPTRQCILLSADGTKIVDGHVPNHRLVPKEAGFVFAM